MPEPKLLYRSLGKKTGNNYGQKVPAPKFYQNNL